MFLLVAVVIEILLKSHSNDIFGKINDILIKGPLKVCGKSV